MGLGCVLNHALASGGTVVALARFDVEVMLRAMQAHQVRQALVAPPLLAALAHHPLVSSFDLSALRIVGSGGAPAGAALEQAAADRLDCLVGQGYGLTEASPLVAVCPFAEPSLMRRGSVGCSWAAPRPRWSTRTTGRRCGRARTARSGCAARS
jgi:acyl-CoA synthetase (AMP-forming)/AMP-acid ligase II